MSNYSIAQHPATGGLTFFSPDAQIELPALWLRERSPDPTQLEAMTQQRLFDSHGIDPLISVSALEPVGESQAWLTFSDTHRALYDFDALSREIFGRSPFPEPQAWDSNLDMNLVRVDWLQMEQPQAFRAALEAYLCYGFIVLYNVPCAEESVLEVGRKFGYIKETNFGRYFEVYSRPDGNDLAYRSVFLGPHTDNPYRDPVPGIQLLHCLVNETSGGLSTLVDSVSVVNRLAAEDPKGHRQLCDIAVQYRFVDKGTELITQRPVISTDARGRTLGVHYSPRLDGLPLLPAEALRHYHKARQRLGQLFSDPDYELRFRLDAGELMLFDNSRVLHGRTAYDPSEGHRHLQGCYIDLDGPRERFASTLKAMAISEA